MGALRIALTASLWIGALVTAAVAAPIVENTEAQKSISAPTDRSPRAAAPAIVQPEARTSYRYQVPESGPPTPGPTDPNAPSS